jgi:hypothetical protein
MNAIGRTSILTLFVRTYCRRMFGITWVSNCWQNGHWRSMYSTSVTGALAEPRVSAFCGIPPYWCWTSEAPGRPFAIEPVLGMSFSEVLLPPPEKTMPRTIPTIAMSATPPAIASTRGLA